MQETGSKISLISKIISGSFSEHLTSAYDLFIYVSSSEISCAVAEKKNNLFIALESWQSTDEMSPAAFLQSAIQESEILCNTNFRRVICCSGFRSATIVPDALFSPETAKDQLLFSADIQHSDEIIVDEIQPIQAKIIFAMPADVFKMITSHFRNTEMHHTATAIAGYLVTNRRSTSEHLVNVNLHNSFFEVYVTKNSQLKLYNIFNFHSAEELVYYLLFVCEQLHLNPETTELELSGRVLPEDELHSMTGKYFRHVKFCSRPENYSYDFGFNDIPNHLHFNLFSQIVCAS